MTPESERSPVSRRPIPMSGTVDADSDTLTHADDDSFYANEAWQANLVTMAHRAAVDTAFYEIAGATVQRLADAIREDRWEDLPA